ncbi:hypothetical protein SynA1528_01720 [Synechococcus sp. A15-28]|nr:hypothetical protein SynA1528_01720 [Synechococcus sp. A15-28]
MSVFILVGLFRFDWKPPFPVILFDQSMMGVASPLAYQHCGSA